MSTLIHDDDIITFVCDDALDVAGYVVAFADTVGHVRKAKITDDPIGVALCDTKDVFTGEAQAGQNVGIVKRVPGLVVRLPVAPNNKAIAYGDDLAVASNATYAGKVDKYGGVGVKIARALEALTSNAGGFIDAMLR